MSLFKRNVLLEIWFRTNNCSKRMRNPNIFDFIAQFVFFLVLYSFALWSNSYDNRTSVVSPWKIWERSQLSDAGNCSSCFDSKIIRRPETVQILRRTWNWFNSSLQSEYLPHFMPISKRYEKMWVSSIFLQQTT